MKATRPARFQSEWATTSITCRRSGYKLCGNVIVTSAEIGTLVIDLILFLILLLFFSAAVRDGGAQWLDSYLAAESGEILSKKKKIKIAFRSLCFWNKMVMRINSSPAV